MKIIEKYFPNLTDKQKEQISKLILSIVTGMQKSM